MAAQLQTGVSRTGGGTKRLAAVGDDETVELPEFVRDVTRLYLTQIAEQAPRIAGLEGRPHDLARESRDLARLQTMPGVGPITAVAIESFAPDLRTFGSGRDFSAWLGLVPRQHSTGGKARLGRVSKMREPRHPTAPGQRGNVGRAVGRPAQRRGRIMARADADAQAEAAGRHRACQPHGAGPVGHGDPRRRVPGLRRLRRDLRQGAPPLSSDIRIWSGGVTRNWPTLSLMRLWFRVPGRPSAEGRPGASRAAGSCRPGW